MKELTMRAARPGVRLLVAAVLAGVMLVALGGLGYAASGGPAATAVEYQYGKKVTICHKGKTIRVSVNALRGHRRHGDGLDACTAADRAKAKLQAKKAKLKAQKAKLQAKKQQLKAKQEQVKAKQENLKEAREKLKDAREKAERGKSDEPRSEHPGKGKGRK